MLNIAKGGELFDRIATQRTFTEVEASRIVRMVYGVYVTLGGLGNDKGKDD